MKLFLLAAAACLATPAFSQSDNQVPMVITAASRPTVTQWSQKLERQLDQHLQYPQTFRPSDDAEGTVSVRFVCDGDGKPTAVALFRSSGNRRIDLAAMRAVALMDTLHPMPTRISHDARFQANIIFAADQPSLDRQQKALRQNEALRIARDNARERTIVVLDFSRRTAS